MQSTVFQSSLFRQVVYAKAHPPREILDKQSQNYIAADYTQSHLIDERPSQQEMDSTVHNKPAALPFLASALSFILEQRSALAYTSNSAPSSTVTRTELKPAPALAPAKRRPHRESGGKTSNWVPVRFRDLSIQRLTASASGVGRVRKQGRRREKHRRVRPEKRRDTLYCCLAGGDWAPV